MRREIQPDQTHPDDEVLAALALGDPGIDQDQQHHVEVCPRCTTGLDELRRTLRIAAAGAPPGLERPDDLERPGAEVWSAVTAEVRDLTAAARSAKPGSGSVAPPVRLGPRRQPRRGVPVAVVLLVATLCLVAGALGGFLLTPASEDPPVDQVVVEVATAELDMVDDGLSTGTATVSRTGSGTDLMLSLPRVDPAGGYLEVWLLDRDLDRMVSVGVVGDSWTPSFSIPRRLLQDGYVVVDISRQSFDEGPTHSGDSIMRGTLSI